MKTSTDSQKLALAFSCLGHVYVHLFTAVYFVIVLALEVSWSRPYYELVELWTLGALMVGVAALPAGWLGDRWSATGMLAVFFVGMGGCSVLAGLSNSPGNLLLALTGMGTFAAIYHPVGIPWLIRNAGRNKGKALGFNGIFGSVGTAAAGVTAGVLIDFASWRAAFIVPGLLCLLTGLALWWAVRTGAIADAENHHTSDDVKSKRDQVRVFIILLITMFLAAVVYHSTQSALPKVLELRQGGLLESGTFGVGVLIGAIYTAAGIMQVMGGHLADRFPLKLVYVGVTAVQIPLLWWAASATGLGLVLVATVMVMAAAGALPAENMLLARYAAARHHGLVFGVKFVLAFGAGPLAIQFVANVNRQTGEFAWVFLVLAMLAAIAACCALLLPGQRKTPVIEPVTAEP